MKLAISLAALAATVTLALPTSASAADAQLRIPDFTHLKGKAIETVDVTVDGLLMKIASSFASANVDEGDEQGRAAMKLLSDIKSVRVRSFKFDRDDAYSKTDIDSVRKQLTGPNWSQLVQVHKRDPQEDVDVFLCLDDGKALGLAVILSQAREFTIVNVVGNIDIDKFAQLEGQFGIPKVSQN